MVRNLCRLYNISSGADFNFAPFPEVKAEFADRVDEFRSLFTGQHDHVLIKAPIADENAEADPDAEPLDEGEKIEDELISESEKEVKPPPQAFYEIDRLVFTIRAIEVDC